MEGMIFSSKREGRYSMSRFTLWLGSVLPEFLEERPVSMIKNVERPEKERLGEGETENSLFELHNIIIAKRELAFLSVFCLSMCVSEKK